MLISELSEQIRTANDAKKPLRIKGGGSKDFYGQALNGDLLNTSGYSGITSYEPTELVITAKAGTLLSEIEDELAAKNQMLGFEPPRFNRQSTIGGVVAAGLSGPRRANVGAVRDFVLGASLLNYHGDELHFGGQVIKNVAGYDVSRVLCGSLGVLGVISQVSLKVLPTVNGDATVSVACSQEQALVWLNKWAGKPLPIVSSCWQSSDGSGSLHLRLAGAPAAVTAAQATLKAEAPIERMDDTEAFSFWATVRDQTHTFFASNALVRYSVPSIASAINIPTGSKALIEWGGALRWLSFTDVETAKAHVAKNIGATLGGSVSLYRQNGGQNGANSIFAPLDPVTLKLHQRLKAEFDPNGIFNRGRLHDSF
jgi:glycolate oxidase FAD binding subunit